MDKVVATATITPLSEVDTAMTPLQEVALAKTLLLEVKVVTVKILPQGVLVVREVRVVTVKILPQEVLVVKEVRAVTDKTPHREVGMAKIRPREATITSRLATLARGVVSSRRLRTLSRRRSKLVLMGFKSMLTKIT